MKKRLRQFICSGIFEWTPLVIFNPAGGRIASIRAIFRSVRPSPIVYAGDLAEQGFPFFSGQITLRNTFRLTQEECVGRCLRFAKRGATVLAVRVNGKPAGKLFWQPYEIDLSRFLLEGENTIEITLTGSLRNLLGPHHLKHGESYSVLSRQLLSPLLRLEGRR